LQNVFGFHSAQIVAPQWFETIKSKKHNNVTHIKIDFEKGFEVFCKSAGSVH